MFVCLIFCDERAIRKETKFSKRKKNNKKFVTHVRPFGDFPRAAAVFVETFALLSRFLTLVAQDGVQHGTVVHHAVEHSLLEGYNLSNASTDGVKNAVPAARKKKGKKRNDGKTNQDYQCSR